MQTSPLSRALLETPPPARGLGAAASADEACSGGQHLARRLVLVAYGLAVADAGKHCGQHRLLLVARHLIDNEPAAHAHKGAPCVVDVAVEVKRAWRQLQRYRLQDRLGLERNVVRALDVLIREAVRQRHVVVIPLDRAHGHVLQCDGWLLVVELQLAATWRHIDRQVDRCEARRASVRGVQLKAVACARDQRERLQDQTRGVLRRRLSDLLRDLRRGEVERVGGALKGGLPPFVHDLTRLRVLLDNHARAIWQRDQALLDTNRRASLDVELVVDVGLVVWIERRLAEWFRERVDRDGRRRTSRHLDKGLRQRAGCWPI